MGLENARAVVSAFLDRLEVIDVRRLRLPDGVVSRGDFEALAALAEYARSPWAAAGGDQVPVSAAPEAPPSRRPNIPIVWNDADGPPEGQVRLCLDFGTAMSKAWATGTKDTTVFPLILGAAAGEGDSLALPSVIYISDRGKIFVGKDAEAHSIADANPDRSRFENIKRLLTEHNIGTDLDEVSVSRSIDPTGLLSEGDLITLFLARLIDLSLVALESLEEIRDENARRRMRHVKRRVGIPCFADAADEIKKGRERAVWAEKLLRRLVHRAQVVADTLHGRWGDLDTVMVKQVMDAVRAGESAHAVELACDDFAVREPIAAGASRFSASFGSEMAGTTASKARHLFMVIDAGAGTTDFAMFQAMGVGNGEFRFGLLAPTIRMSRIAGNAVDAIVFEEMLKACGVNPHNGSPLSEDDFRYLKADAKNQVRDIKREVLLHDSTEIVLKPNAVGVVQRSAILMHPKYQGYVEKLTKIREGIVDAAVDSHFAEVVADRNRRLGPMPIRVVLTGGSAALPLIRDLASGEIEVKGAQFKFSEIKVLPDWVNRLERDMSELVASGFAQSAVAIGGAVPVLPEELGDLTEVISPAMPGPRTLERYPVKGL